MLNLTGERFGRLSVICRSQKKSTHGDALWECQCECGNTYIAKSHDLRHGITKHCGCEKGKNISKGVYRHGCEPKRLYDMWRNMKNRCNNKNYFLYHRYGGRGIKVCEEWEHSFSNFRAWALKNGYADNLTIDRINNDIGYCPSNCRFSSVQEQSNNRSTNRYIEAYGIKDTLANVARKYGLKYSQFQHLLDVGICPENAIERLVQNNGICS